MIKVYKRLLAILIVIALSCSYVTINAVAENDGETEEKSVVSTENGSYGEGISPKVQKMMTVLKAFDIIPDYYDYNVPLTYEVSRSDFAASVARMMGKTAYNGSEVYFYDVPKNYWAFNEISNLTEMGILSGAGDKTFNPGEPITKAAAYKILLCAMGYREYAERAGGYPRGYTSVASSIKLAKGVSGGENVTMSDMLNILYNALTVNTMELGSMSGDSITFETSEDETLISQYRNIYYGKGDVNGANTVTTDGTVLSKDYTLIDDEKYKCEGFNMMEYIGEKVEFFYEDDDSSDEKKLLWVGRSESSQEIKIISADYDAYLDTDTFTYTYYDESGRRHRIEIDRSALLVYNGAIVDSGYDAILNNNRYELKLISNGSKHTMVVREYKNYVVGNINSIDHTIYDKNNPQDFVNLDEDDYETFSIKLMGRDEITFDDISNGAVLSVYLSKDKKHIEVYVSHNSVSGTIEGISTEDYKKITINGNEYRVDNNLSSDSYSIGDNVTAYTDVYGEIVYITAKAGVFQGSFLISASFDRRGEYMYIRQLGEDSKVTKLRCAENLIIDGKRYKTAQAAYTALLAGESKLTAQFALIKKNSDGDIKEIDTVTYDKSKETSNSLQIDVPFWYGSETTYTQRLIRANANAARIGEKIVFDADTKVFIVPFVTDYDKLNDDEFWSTVGSKLTNDTGTYAQSYKTAKKIGVTKYLLLKGYDPNKTNAELPILAQKITQGMDDDGNIVETLEGYQGMSPVSVRAHESVSDLFSKNGVLPGDVVTLTKDSYGNVKSCTVVYDYRTGDHKAITALNDISGMFVGFASDVVDNVVKIGFTSGAEYDFAINAMSKPVLVYDTSKTKDAVSVATTGDIVTYENSPANCSTVFIATNRMQPQVFIVYK